MSTSANCSCGDASGAIELTTIPKASAPIACDLAQIPSENLIPHKSRAQYLFGEALQERNELENGFAFRFKPDDYAVIADFIAHERLCCPFFSFTLVLQPDLGPIWLQITGRDGVKDLLKSTFSDGELWEVS